MTSELSKAEKTVAFYKKVFSNMEKDDFEKVDKQEIVQMLDSIQLSIAPIDEKKAS